MCVRVRVDMSTSIYIPADSKHAQKKLNEDGATARSKFCESKCGQNKGQRSFGFAPSQGFWSKNAPSKFCLFRKSSR